MRNWTYPSFFSSYIFLCMQFHGCVSIKLYTKPFCKLILNTITRFSWPLQFKKNCMTIHFKSWYIIITFSYFFCLKAKVIVMRKMFVSILFLFIWRYQYTLFLKITFKWFYHSRLYYIQLNSVLIEYFLCFTTTYTPIIHFKWG